MKIIKLKNLKNQKLDHNLTDKKIIDLETRLLDSIDPLLREMKNTTDRLTIAGTVLKVALILYQADLGKEATAGLMYEVGDQVDNGLLEEADVNGNLPADYNLDRESFNPEFDTRLHNAISSELKRAFYGDEEKSGKIRTLPSHRISQQMGNVREIQKTQKHSPCQVASTF